MITSYALIRAQVLFVVALLFMPGTRGDANVAVATNKERKELALAEALRLR